MALMTSLVSLLIAVLARVLGDEFKDSAPQLCKRLIAFAVTKLPEDRAAECAEEWQSFVNDRHSNLNKVRSSLGFIIAAYRIRWSLSNGLWQRMDDKWYGLRSHAKIWSLKLGRTASFLLPCGMILGIFYWFLNSNYGFISASSNFWCGVGLGVFLLIMIHRGLRRMPRIRIVASSCMLATMFAGILLHDYQQSVARFALSFDWARSKTETLAFSALEHKRFTGVFPDYSDARNIANSYPSDIKFSSQSASHVTYIVKVPGLPGEMIADLNDDGGEIRWQEGRKVLKQMDLVTGVVIQNQLSSGTVLFQHGSKARLPEGTSVTPPPGSVVVAAIDPENATISHYQAISFAKTFK